MAINRIWNTKENVVKSLHDFYLEGRGYLFKSKKELKELSDLISKITPCFFPDSQRPACLLRAYYTQLCIVCPVHISHLFSKCVSARGRSWPLFGMLSVNTVDITDMFARCNLKTLRVIGSISFSYLCCELKEVDSEEISQIRRRDWHPQWVLPTIRTE